VTVELNLNPETAATLNKIAASTGRGMDELIDEAVAHLAAYNAWFDRRVRESMAAAERGEIVSHEEARAWMDKKKPFHGG
jgi:predicted transcriptional regulator